MINIRKLFEDITRFLHTNAYEQKEEYFNKTLRQQDQIAELKKETETLFDNCKKMSQIIDDQEDLIESLENKHTSLEKYKKWMDANIVPQNQYYDFGQGKKQPHTIFAQSIKDEKIILDFIENFLKFDVSRYNTIDNMVFGFNEVFSYRVPTSKYYASDKTLYGVMEYWATAKETIEKINKGGKAFDCDDNGILRYSCLYLLIKKYYPTEIYRLRGFIVDLFTGDGHFMLGWLRGDDVNDWVPIETTFYNERQSTLWIRKYTIRDQILYRIKYSFDNKHEYVMI